MDSDKGAVEFYRTKYYEQLEKIESLGEIINELKTEMHRVREAKGTREIRRQDRREEWEECEVSPMQKGCESEK